MSTVNSTHSSTSGIIKAAETVVVMIPGDCSCIGIEAAQSAVVKTKENDFVYIKAHTTCLCLAFPLSFPVYQTVLYGLLCVEPCFLKSEAVNSLWKILILYS